MTGEDWCPVCGDDWEVHDTPDLKKCLYAMASTYRHVMGDARLSRQGVTQ